MNLADAKAKFSAVVDDVRRTARRYVLLRHGKPAAAIVSVEDLEQLEESTPRGRSPAGALALVGLWADLDDEAIDEFLRDIYESRAADLGRPVRFEP